MTAESLLLSLKNQHLQTGSVLLFDFDGSLLDTNLTNNEAYNYGLFKVTGTSKYPTLNNLRRITRKDVAEISGITPDMLKEIVQYKKNSVWYNREYTYPYITQEILKRQSDNIPCYIITSADPERVQQLARFYQLNQLVKDYIYTDSVNKYEKIATKLHVEPSQIYLFEDEDDAIGNAIQNGIDENKIIQVFPDTLKKQIIRHNASLKHDVIAYYSLDYVGYQKIGNPDFINDLKNQYNTYSEQKVYSAMIELKKYLKRDIHCIYDMMNVSELTIVAIPRAKAELFYNLKQQYFRRGIQETVEELQNEYGLNLIDGSHYIIRHTNTKTTHLSKKENVNNDGELPYPGITKATCDLSDNIAGKDILLIDDIYTLDVNIDEDAIQALYDKGAKSFRFYSVCKTFKVRKRL